MGWRGAGGGEGGTMVPQRGRASLIFTNPRAFALSGMGGAEVKTQLCTPSQAMRFRRGAVYSHTRPSQHFFCKDGVTHWGHGVACSAFSHYTFMYREVMTCSFKSVLQPCIISLQFWCLLQWFMKPHFHVNDYICHYKAPLPINGLLLVQLQGWYPTGPSGKDLVIKDQLMLTWTTNHFPSLWKVYGKNIYLAYIC